MKPIISIAQKVCLISGLAGAWPAMPSAQVDSPGEFSRYLPTMLDNVAVDEGSVVDVTMQTGALITGAINAPLHLATSAMARNSVGVVFRGAVQGFIGQQYGIAVPPGDTYTVTLCLISLLPGGPVVAHEDQVVVNADDVMRDQTPVPVDTHRVSGNIAGRDPAFPQAVAMFATEDARTGSSALLDAFDNYEVFLADGVYKAGVIYFNEDGSRILAEELGSVEVAGTDVTFNATAPPTGRLTGTLSLPDGPIPSGSSVQATGSAWTAVQGCVSPPFSGGTAPVDPTTGAYDLGLPVGITYDIAASVVLQPAAPPQGPGLLTFWTPGVAFPGDLQFDVSYPATPALVTLSGSVTPAGTFALVARSANMLDPGGGSELRFERSGQVVDTSYALALLAGTYTLQYRP